MVWQTGSSHDHTYSQDDSGDDPVIVGPFSDIGLDIKPSGMDKSGYTGLLTIQWAYAAGGEEKDMVPRTIPDLNKASKPAWVLEVAGPSMSKKLSEIGEFYI